MCNMIGNTTMDGWFDDFVWTKNWSKIFVFSQRFIPRRFQWRSKTVTCIKTEDNFSNKWPFCSLFHFIGLWRCWHKFTSVNFRTLRLYPPSFSRFEFWHNVCLLFLWRFGDQGWILSYHWIHLNSNYESF